MGWFARREPRISDDLWTRLLTDYGFIGARPEHELIGLRRLSNQFLAGKQFAGAEGLMIDDYIGASIAIQACLPVLGTGLNWYDDFSQIIVYPDQFRYRGSHEDEAGLVHEDDGYLAGQSIDTGPVVLSWADARAGQAEPGYNVVIHEFIHKIDLRDGMADGVPPLPRSRRQRWLDVLDAAYDDFVQACDDAERRLPRHIDPESDEALPYFEHLPLDSYAAEHPSEFFAVLGETLFTDPLQVRNAFAEMHGELTRFFRLNPLDHRFESIAP